MNFNENFKNFKNLFVFLFFISLASPVNATETDILIDKNDIEFSQLDTLDEAKMYFEENPELLDLETYVKINQEINNRTIITFVVVNPGLDTCYGSKSSFNLSYCVSQHSLVMSAWYSNAYKSCYNPIYNNAQDCWVYAYVYTGNKFTEYVQNGGKWDYKLLYPSYSTKVTTKINGVTYYLTAEDIGNIHYGYVGYTVFPTVVLKSAAGWNNYTTNGFRIEWFSSYFDDPNDTNAIQRGINWKVNGYFS